MKKKSKDFLKIQKSIDYLNKIFKFPDFRKADKAEEKIEQVLQLLIDRKCLVSLNPIGRSDKKCMICSFQISENDRIDLSCSCFLSCHKKCIAQKALLMSPELNENKIKIICFTCSKFISFQTILNSFEKEEIAQIKFKYHCKFCDKSISSDLNPLKIKTCLCQQCFHTDCLKKKAREASSGLNKDELRKNLICLNCKNPLAYELWKQCFTEKEFINIQNDELSRLEIEALLREDKEENKRQADNKSAVCTICDNEKVISTSFITLDCDHRFCKECLVKLAETNIDELKCTEKDLICPECRKPISNIILEFILKKEKFAKYEDFVLHHIQSKIIGNDEVALKCPNGNCVNFFVIEKNSDITHHVCELCKLDFCVNGCKEAHRKKTCKQYLEYLAELRRQEEERRLAEIQRIAEEEKRQEELIKFNEWKEMNDKADQQFNLLVAKEKLRACPNCNVWVQKTQGCNHITCKKCNHQFCYICGRADYGKCGDQFKQV